jgi:hypothetical protein
MRLPPSSSSSSSFEIVGEFSISDWSFFVFADVKCTVGEPVRNRGALLRRDGKTERERERE